MNIEQHNTEIYKNIKVWNTKKSLQSCYQAFYKLIAEELILGDGFTVELGSGMGNIKSVIPHCITTDLFANPWLDRHENAYRLSFGSNELDNLILFDVWHHLEYPGSALEEFSRVLKKGGRIIIFDPAVSLLGCIVFGLFHHEPLALKRPIRWSMPKGMDIENMTYYAAQGNAYRVFQRKEFLLENFDLLKLKRFSALSYVMSGGFSHRQLYPDNLYELILKAERFMDIFPSLFATRILIVLNKK